MFDDVPFTLQRTAKKAPKADLFENAYGGRQKRLFVGVYDLPGQQSLFNADGRADDQDERQNAKD